MLRFIRSVQRILSVLTALLCYNTPIPCVLFYFPFPTGHVVYHHRLAQGKDRFRSEAIAISVRVSRRSQVDNGSQRSALNSVPLLCLS